MTETVASDWDSHVHVFEGGAPVLSNHYHPIARPLSEIEALGEGHGIGHLVLVQPSVYGTDNRVLLDALRKRPGRHRGVVVTNGALAVSEFEAMHALGVRGVRFNLVSPVGWRFDIEGTLRRLAPALRDLNWHVQWYADAAALPYLADLQLAFGLRFVLDHLAGMHLQSAKNEEAWTALRVLASGDTWVKLSGWYRLGSSAPYEELDEVIDGVSSLFGNHLLWGSDWPHTSFDPNNMPGYESTWSPVLRVLGEEAFKMARRQAPELLYR